MVSRPLLISLLVASSLLCGIGDYLTGTDVVFTSVYLLPVIGATWWLGRPYGFLFSIVNGAIYLVADLLARGRYLAPPARMWNTGVQVCVFITIVILLDVLRGQFQRSRRAEDRLHALSGRLVELQETERRRIAREIHDEIGQVLTAVKIMLKDVCRHSNEPPVKTRIEAGTATVDRALEQVRSLSLDLRPSILDDLGLVPTLRWYLDRQGRETGIESHLSVGPMRDRFAPEIEIACFRVAQECITNALRHSLARRLWVDIREEPTRLELLVRDDGQGFDLASVRERATAGLCVGLSCMEERVSLTQGTLLINSRKGAGTEIQAFFPLEGAAA